MHHTLHSSAPCTSRECSHLHASTSGPQLTPCPRRTPRRRQRLQVSAAILDPPSFYPEKLSVSYINGSSSTGPAPCIPRRYTLTHNDVTGALQLTIGREYNRQQVAGVYTRLLRDEITAEWVQGSDGPRLHVHCHVSGEEKWLAPPILRNFIFRREMNLVLDTFLHADRELLQLLPELPGAKVLVHFHSDVRFLNRVEEWGTLGDRSSWQTSRGMLFRDMWEQLIAWTLGDDLDLGEHLRQQQQQGKQHGRQQEGAAAPAAAAAAQQQQQDQQQHQESWARRRRQLEAAAPPSCSNGAGTAGFGAGVPAGVAVVAAAAAADDAAAAESESPAEGAGSACSAPSSSSSSSSSSTGSAPPAACAGSSSTGSSSGWHEGQPYAAGGGSSSSSSSSAAVQPLPVHITVSSGR